MKADWKTVTLGDVAEFVRGINFKPDDVVPTGTPGSVACMRTKNVQAELDLSDVWSVGEQFVRREEQFLQAGDVLVSSANSWNLVGKCCWIPELPGRASFGGFVSVLRPHRAKVEPRFLFRWFSSDRIQTTVRSFGQQTTNISNLNTDRCLNLPLPLPPLTEQQRIAEVLDRAEALRAKRSAALAQLDSLTQSIFLDLFGDPATNPKGWLTSALAELGQIYTGKTPPTKLPDMFGGEIPFATPGDLDGRLASTERTLTNGGAECTKVVRAGSALVGCIGNIGKMAKTPARCAFNQQINAVEWNERIHDDYGIAALAFAIPQMMALSSSTTVPILNKSGFMKVELRVPPLPLQREFARRVTAVEALKTAQRASLAELDALFAALQQRAFRGEL